MGEPGAVRTAIGHGKGLNGTDTAAPWGTNAFLTNSAAFILGARAAAAVPSPHWSPWGGGGAQAAGAGGSACVVGGSGSRGGGGGRWRHGDREGPDGGGCVTGGSALLPFPFPSSSLMPLPFPRCFTFSSLRAVPLQLGRIQVRPRREQRGRTRGTPRVLRLSPGKRAVCDLSLDLGFALIILYIFPSLQESVCVRERECSNLRLNFAA